VPDLPSRPVPGWSDGEHQAPWSTGRGEIRADRAPSGRPESTPFVERRASRLPSVGARPAAGPAEMPAYGDWTKPSGPGRMLSAPVPPLPGPPPAPLTTAIPDRTIVRRGSGADGLDDLDGSHDDDRHALGDRVRDDRYQEDAYEVADVDAADGDDDRKDALEVDLPTTSGPVTGSVVGGRAAQRAEREAREARRLAAEAARRKEAKRNGTSLDDDEDRPHRPRRMLKGLVAIAVVAAGVMGVYTVTTPDTVETSTSTPSAPSTEPTTAPTSAAEVTQALPPLDTEPSQVEAAPTPPVRVPVTVLNATDVPGLAARISSAIGAEKWETVDPGGYPNGDVAATTVFFAKGDEEQRQAALQLTEQFPQIEGPAERFFEVPSTIDAPGLVVVAAGDWTP
jgi:hypothetical protein